MPRDVSRSDAEPAGDVVQDVDPVWPGLAQTPRKQPA